MAKNTNFFKSRKFKYGSVATGLTVAFVAVVIIINVIFSLLADTYSWKLDMTSYDLYSLSDSTRQVVNALSDDQQIKLTVMYSEEEYPDQFKETLKRFVNLSDNITIEYVDPDVNPQILTSFGAEFSIEEGAIVVENGDRKRVIAFSDMYEQDSSSYNVTYKTEECLTSAVLYVTKAEIPLVYFVTGHGESGYDSFMNLIANNGADVQEVKLSQLSTFDEMARVMVICGPTMDYSEAEIYQLQQFLANDYNYERDIFYFSNPEAPELPNLEGLLAEWGLALGHDLVMETDDYTASTYASSTDEVPRYLIPTYTEAEISGVPITTDYLSVVPSASSVELLFDAQDITETAALMTTSDESYAKSSDAINTYEKVEGDREGPFNVAAIATRYRYQDNVAIESHVFVAGSVEMLGATYMTYNGNSGFLFEVYKMMVGETENELVGTTKTAESTYMTMSTSAIRWGSIVFIVIIPAIFLVIGIIVYIRRRFL
ncbi:MAG: GldG family protein [Clostridia bacterium]|nr:GldG family protein [Clostridia bacterium]